MEGIDRDILSLRHVVEDGYAAFAVLQISTSCIGMDLEKLLRAVKKLVGELDFSYSVLSTEMEKGSDTASSGSGEGEGEGEDGGYLPRDGARGSKNE